MVALSVVLGAVVLLLAVLVAGLLRSHADILKALHDLGAGVGDPAGGALTTTSPASSAGGASVAGHHGPDPGSRPRLDLGPTGGRCHPRW